MGNFRSYVGNVALAFAAISAFLVIFIYIPIENFGFKDTAQYLGTIVAATLGFITLISGHFCSAHLNQIEAKEARKSRLGDIATAILTETLLNLITLHGIANSLQLGTAVSSKHVIGMSRALSTRVFDEYSVDFYSAISETREAASLSTIICFLSTIRLFTISLIETAPTEETILLKEQIQSLLDGIQSAERQAANALHEMQNVVQILRNSNEDLIGGIITSLKISGYTLPKES